MGVPAHGWYIMRLYRGLETKVECLYKGVIPWYLVFYTSGVKYNTLIYSAGRPPIHPPLQAGVTLLPGGHTALTLLYNCITVQLLYCTVLLL